MAKMADTDVTKLVWILEDDIADPTEPTDDELNAGVDITCAVVSGYTLGATASDTNNEKSVCDTANVTTFTYDNYAGDLMFFREGDSAATDSIFDDAHDAFKTKGVVGWLVRRIDPDKGAADDFAAADVVELYKFETDNPIYSSGTADGAKVKFQTVLGQAGAMHLNVAVVAGA
jgi:hypothetical protein